MDALYESMHDTEAEIRAVHTLSKDQERLLVKKRLARIKRQGGWTPVKTRGTLAWRESQPQKSAPIRRYIPEYLIDPHSDDDYVAIGRSGRSVEKPVFAVKNTVYYVVHTTNKSGKRVYKHKKRFTKCCSGSDAGGRYCERKTCANCYTRDHRPTKKGYGYYIQQIVDGSTPKIVDTLGVHPKGHRDQRAKALGLEEAQTYKLTSNLYNYRGPKQKQ